jgi:tripartite-type tricarboxylate transporter receptor subunit TctC
MSRPLHPARLRRRLAAFALVLLSCSGAALAQYPAKSIKMIVPYPPGGATDVIGRVLAQRLSGALGQQVVIDNRGGAGGDIGAEAAAKSPPDGYTILMGALTSHSIMATLEKDTIRYNLERDLTPVAVVGSVPLVWVVHPSLPVKDLKEFVAYARNNPGKLTYASSGAGAPQRMCAELFRGMTVQLVRAGKLRALAVTTATRISMLPDVPTTAEQGMPGYEVSSLFGVLVPAGTPRPIIDRLNAELAKILATPEAQAQLLEQGAYAVQTTPEQAAARVHAEIAMWAKVIKQASIKVD